jgi:hypothetical protein
VAATELILVTGERLAVEGTPKQVEAAIVGAARGSIMELAWLVEAHRGESIAVNPEHVVVLRAADGSAPTRT